MMETKLWAALCALLLINLGSAEPDGGYDAASNATNSKTSEVAAPESVPSSGLEPISPAVTATTHVPDTNSSSRVTSSLSNDTATEGTPGLKNDNGTNIESSSLAAGSERNLTDQSTSQPPSPPSLSHSPTSHTPLTTTTTTTLTTTQPSINPVHTVHTTPVDTTPTTTQLNSTSGHAQSVTSTPKVETTPSPTTVIRESSSTSSNSSSQTRPSPETPTVHTPQPDEHPETTSVSHQINTNPTPRSSSTQTEAKADVPSKLNVEGDTTMVRDSPTLDPLLAGLVSAFIITAVIITLLLFLKLRRRDNRPEFRRLQDLPMDDMMEDTPLSMYSY